MCVYAMHVCMYIHMCMYICMYICNCMYLNTYVHNIHLCAVCLHIPLCTEDLKKVVKQH